MLFYYFGTFANPDADIDEQSLQFANRNVLENGLQTRVKLLQTQSNGPLVPLDILGVQKYVS